MERLTAFSSLSIRPVPCFLHQTSRSRTQLLSVSIRTHSCVSFTLGTYRIWKSTELVSIGAQALSRAHELVALSSNFVDLSAKWPDATRHRGRASGDVKRLRFPEPRFCWGGIRACAGRVQGADGPLGLTLSYEYAGDALSAIAFKTRGSSSGLWCRVRPVTVNCSTKKFCVKKRTKREASPGHSRDTQQRRNVKLLICG